jgi:hypothetical protein
MRARRGVYEIVMTAGAVVDRITPATCGLLFESEELRVF